jgi:L-seryl-tRNA(Ser) seleniumtransferase
LILRVHPSNFRIEGFTERPPLADLVHVGRKFSIPVAEDLGSGNLGATSDRQPSDPSVRETLEAGVDVCCFSGDKLLGGPQAGIIVGRTAIVQAVRRHPLMRALRVDKLTYAALEATLAEYAAGRAATTVPVQRMLALTKDSVRVRATALADAVNGLQGWTAQIVDGVSAIGGGSAPGVDLPTALVAIAKQGLTADALEGQLRALTPPVIARIEEDRVVLDLRTVADDRDRAVIHALASL